MDSLNPPTLGKLFFSFSQGKTNFPGAERRGVGGKKKVSRKGKTRCTPTTRAPAERERGSVRRPGPRCGRGGRLATPPPSAAQFWVGLGVGRGWWREGGGGGGRECEPPRTMSNPSPKLHQSRNRIASRILYGLIMASATAFRSCELLVTGY